MGKEEILAALEANILALTSTCREAPAERFFRSPEEGKWSAAQNLRHLVLAVRPLNLAFSLPLAALRLFGTPRKPSASYDQLVDRYRGRLANGAKASAPFVPGSRGDDKEVLIGQVISSYRKLTLKVRVLSEKSLDHYFLPHPILGKITVREMLYFTVYHVKHHHQIVIDRLK